MTAIGWATKTWNPSAGCSIASHGCSRCYAMAWAAQRLDGNSKSPWYAGTTEEVGGIPVWTGKVAQAPEKKIMEPLRWKTPQDIFVNSMSDLFHEQIERAFIDRVFAIMWWAERHRFMVLTKRESRMRSYMNDPDAKWRVFRAVRSYIDPEFYEGSRFTDDDACPVVWPIDNIALGVSCEDQKWFERRAFDLRATPAACRFISFEPLLGQIAATPESLKGIDWAIFGEESGPRARQGDLRRMLFSVNSVRRAGVRSIFVKQIQGLGGQKITDMAQFPPELRSQDLPPFLMEGRE